MCASPANTVRSRWASLAGHWHADCQQLVQLASLLRLPLMQPAIVPALPTVGLCVYTYVSVCVSVCVCNLNQWH